MTAADEPTGAIRMMNARVLADATLILHTLFVVFVVLGGVLVLWWPRVAFLHLPAVAWGAWVEFTGTICPLTPLENQLRNAAGEAGYAGGFIEHYLMPVLYPEGLTSQMQFAFGVVVVVLNTLIYGRAWRQMQQKRRAGALRPLNADASRRKLCRRTRFGPQSSSNAGTLAAHTSDPCLPRSTARAAPGGEST